eukprot:CAMPEP_0115060064 /NCGR_PEP_ID=MMETSP0227-20121206/7260_1 /TAXON_ID=89957 /ORGANISM="Polarella glacialis, Strain CCMP 1383" /LENGTH=86 /DNA_ID=CAMNT_0002445245 /DNA_START=491 /DNA_END=751 /DNA_ORIENTATION=-
MIRDPSQKEGNRQQQQQQAAAAAAAAAEEAAAPPPNDNTPHEGEEKSKAEQSERPNETKRGLSRIFNVGTPVYATLALQLYANCAH